ncbi:MAG TPA: phosphatase PAP2 family protein [Solirubrobacteraceae bacterium]|jgi:undecaprenyl-diphosphatase
MMRTAVCLVLGLVVLVLVGWGVGALWTSIVGSGEEELMRGLAEQRTPTLTAIARAVTWAGSLWLLVPLALACCVLLVRAGLPRQAAAVALSLAGASLIADLVKVLVGRPRPPVEHLQTVTGPSFPSAHSSQAGAFWFSLVLAMQSVGVAPTRVRWAVALAALIVLAVALSRVYLGVHYPSDVIAGVVLGAGWAVYVCACVGEMGRPSRKAHR